MTHKGFRAGIAGAMVLLLAVAMGLTSPVDGALLFSAVFGVLMFLMLWRDMPY